MPQSPDHYKANSLSTTEASKRQHAGRAAEHLSKRSLNLTRRRSASGTSLPSPSPRYPWRPFPALSAVLSPTASVSPSCLILLSASLSWPVCRSPSTWAPLASSRSPPYPTQPVTITTPASSRPGVRLPQPVHLILLHYCDLGDRDLLISLGFGSDPAPSDLVRSLTHEW